ncbi:DUF6064 family protein [Massilia niastensis]|uniref:DUF6064 family protein n=1 Tax=Massilia niastensis TaxID=544911 RepID=UPI000363AC49|nr:DUF6064 family protein [Massilia niastensis]
MSEWWTYTLADLLMFSARTYYRLFELYNRDIWPAHVLADAAGMLVIGCIVRAGALAYRIAYSLLAVSWGWIAWAYHWERYADINIAAPYFAAGFSLQALMLGWLALQPNEVPAERAPARLAAGIVGLSVIGYPLLALREGRGWVQAEIFGIAPDPTVAATLGVLLVSRGHWVTWSIPIAWCAVNGATLMELQVDHAWLLPALAVVTVAVGLFSRRVTHPGAML